MKTTQINKSLSYISNYALEDYFEKKVTSFADDSQEKILQWFSGDNLYPNRVITDIRKGTTLESVLFEDNIYKTGNGFNTSDSALLSVFDDINFKDLFAKTNDNFTKLGNNFTEIIVDDTTNGNLIAMNVLQPQKVRLGKNGKSAIVYSDWANYNKKKSVTLPLYPNFKKFTNKGIVYFKSILHIKNEVNGFDHYGLNEKMSEALLLNEKEHRRNNWQLNQIKNGFKKDFFLISDFELTQREKAKADEAFKEMSGDGKNGGIATIESEGGKLVPATDNYDFDFTKDDTSDQIFLKMGFPRSLIGIKSGSAFSVEQVESDYDQYLPKVENQQTKIISEYKTIFNNHTKANVNDLQVINTPPSIVLQNYMQYMNEEQKSKVIENVFDKYGI
jgi:hypothetical protein